MAWPDTAWFLDNDAHLEEAKDVVFWVGREGCSPRTRSIDLVSQNRAIKHDRSAQFTRSSLSNFSPCNLTAYAICLSEYISITPFQWPQLSAEWRAKVSMFAQGGDTSGSKVYRTERKAPIQPGTHTWTMGWRWRSRPDSAADLSRSATFSPPFTFLSPHTTSVFTPNQ